MISRSQLLPLLAVAFAAACAVERERDEDGGVHPATFADKGTPDFHGSYLKNNLYPLKDCRACHGDDYGGGAVGVSCNTANCHSQGVEHCGTCHDGKSPPQPTTGGHEAHGFPCSDCHDVPVDARGPAHPDGETAVVLTGLATLAGSEAAWIPESRTCAATYCHGAQSPEWEPVPGRLDCDTCHESPPTEKHARFPVAAAPDGCAPCHGEADGPLHLNGQLDILEPTCSQCHGKDPTGSPPPALDGSTSPTDRGVGAHARHLDETLLDRIGRPLECVQCHDVPDSMLASGHMDAAAPADVWLLGGAYAPETASCVVGCHWDEDPGPVWTDTSGAARTCDACHGFPPVVTRTGAPHPEVAPDAEACRLCHTLEIPTHVDGHVDFLP